MARLEEITGKAVSGEWGDEDTEGNGVPVLRAANFANDGSIDFTKVVTRRIEKNVSGKLLRPGDILIEKSGGSDAQPVGRVVFYEEARKPCLFNNFTGLLRVRDSSAWLPKYVFYALFANYARGGTRRYENRTTGIHNLRTAQYVADTAIPDKSFSEQEKIVAVLDKTSELIRLRKRQLAKLDELVKSQFIACFTLDCKYPIVPIGALVDENIERKKVLFGKYDTIRYIDISSIDNRQRKITEFVEYPIHDAPSRAQQLLKKDDILVSTVRPNLQNIARNPYSDGNIIASTGFCVLRCSKCLPEYLWGVVLSEKFTRAMSKQAKGANYPAVGNNDILQYLVPNAPISKQERFAAFVEQCDQSKLALRQGLEKLETLKMTLMQTYFG